MTNRVYEDCCLYCWGDPRAQETLLSGRIYVCVEEARFEADDIVLAWPYAKIQKVSYEPTHPVDVDAVAGGNIDAAQDIAIALAMDHIPKPAISILLEDPEGIMEDGFDIRIVFDTAYRAKLAMRRIQSAMGTRYSGLESQCASDEEESASGWTRVDRALEQLRMRLKEARTAEQCQAVGLLCREILISLAQAVYDPEAHTPTDDVQPSRTDAARMLGAYFAAELEGKQNEVARRHARASLNLANALQHRRTATTREARLCAEATASVVNIVAVLSGRYHTG